MATRGAYGVKIDGKYRLNYHHFDSFPEYLGRDICSLIAEINRDGGWDVFTTNFRKVALVYPGDTASDELVQRYKHPNEEDDGKGVAEWYNLLRGFQGARLLRGIYKGEIAHLPEASDFIRDSYCEYAYAINCDEMVFEYYRGGQTSPQPGNPFGITPNADGYYPCRLVVKIPLADIDENTFMELIDRG